MYDVIKNVIASKRYELADMLKKIDTLWVQGNLTEEQRLELILLAQNNAKVENSVDILNKLADLDKRVTALEKANEPVEDENVSGDEDVTEVVTYPEYEVGKWYYTGDKVSFDGRNYVCVAPDGVACVWSPAEYPTYWGLVVEESTEITEETE